MLIINADDWGRSKGETNAILVCHRAGRITSTSAMVFMQDSVRAADLAKDARLDVGLHLNLTQSFDGIAASATLTQHHESVIRYLTSHKYARVLYKPSLRRAFDYLYKAQYHEFVRLYGRAPSHIDGHHHQHLCANILLGDVIPKGEMVRRNFFFWPSERNIANRLYRRLSDAVLIRRYRSTDFFLALGQCMRDDRLDRVAELALKGTVELMTHPFYVAERRFLLGDRFLGTLGRLERGPFVPTGFDVSQPACVDCPSPPPASDSNIIAKRYASQCLE